MSKANYLEQKDKPLFPDVLWSRPETKSGAGKLLIIGGQAQEFSNVAECFTAAERAGAGIIRVMMPESTQKFTKMLPNIEYASANNSGSFSKEALAVLLEAAAWSDAVLLAGDLGKNSETSLMLESFINKYSGILVTAPVALESLSVSFVELLSRPGRIIVMEYASMQKVGIEYELEKPVLSDSNTADIANVLHDITTKSTALLVINNENSIWTAERGKAAITRLKTKMSGAAAASRVSVWAMQQPAKVYEAVTTSLIAN